MTVLVTGGAGFIGGHAMLALRDAEYDVIAYDDLSNGHEAQLLGAPLVVGDIRDEKALNAVFAQNDIEAVIHFAGLIEAGRSVQEPDMFHDVNVNGTKTLLSVMRTHRIDRIVFSSTAAVYGQPLYTPINETHPLLPINPYGETKAAAEKLLHEAQAEWGLHFAALRYFNAAGGDPEARIGERHDPETHLIPLAIDAALGKRPPLQIFGDDYDTADGTCIRDYVHVSDLAAAHVLALRHLLEGNGSLTANLGTGVGHSVRDVLACVSETLGRPVPNTQAPRREGDPATLVCTADRARCELDWTPLWPDLSDMIAHAAKFRQN